MLKLDKEIYMKIALIGYGKLVKPLRKLYCIVATKLYTL